MSIVPVVTVADLYNDNAVPTLLQHQAVRMGDPVLAKAIAAEFNDGDFFISISPMGHVAYGEISKEKPVRPDDEVLAGLPDEQREEILGEFIGELEMFNALEENGYLFGTCYSVMCPEGEMESTHVHLVTAKIDKQTFERAKANGWHHIAPVN